MQYNILDLGCGSGDFLGRISSAVSSQSSLIGIDSRQKPIDQASSLYPNIDFQQEKFINYLSFPDYVFDFVISVDTMECIPDKTALVREVAGVLSPNGTIVFVHWDWDTQVYNYEHKNIIRKFTAEFSDWQQGWMDACDGQTGRRLWGLLQGSGLFMGAMESFTLLESVYEEGLYGFDRLRDLLGLMKAGRIDSVHTEMVDCGSDTATAARLKPQA